MKPWAPADTSPSDEAMGPGGYLSERGLIPLKDDRRAEVQKTANDAVKMSAKN